MGVSISDQGCSDSLLEGYTDYNPGLCNSGPCNSGRSESIGYVVPGRSIGQVFESVILRIAVEMANMHTLFLWTYERPHDQSVDMHEVALAIYVYVDAQMTATLW
jgi:hypothetical protein